MEEFNVIDPNTGIGHMIPFEHLSSAMESGGQFANLEDKQRAINLSQSAGQQSQDSQAVNEPNPREEQPRREDSLHGALQKVAGEYLLKSFGSIFKHPAVSTQASMALGVPQGLVNTLSSAGNMGPEAYEAITGKKAGRIPKLDLEKYAPEKIGFSTGEFLGGIAAPLGGVSTAVGKIPKLSNALKNIATGAITGFAASEGNRKTGAAAGAAIPAVAKGASNLTKSIADSFANKADPVKLVKYLQSKQSTLDKGFKDTFNYVGKEVKARDIPAFEVPEATLDSAKIYLAKTPAVNKLIDQAKTGDYESLRKLQAVLRTKGEKALSSESQAENNFGEEMLEVRKEINSSMANHLEETGHKDLSDDLNAAKSGYRDMKKLYFANNQLAKIFGKEKEIPVNPLNIFKKDSTSMNAFKKAYPEIEEMMSKALKQEKIRKVTKRGLEVAGTGAAAATGYEGVKSLLK